jgi:hypothetical protein
MVVGAAGLIAPGVGGVAMSLVKEFLWPILRKEFGWE